MFITAGQFEDIALDRLFQFLSSDRLRTVKVLQLVDQHLDRWSSLVGLNRREHIERHAVFSTVDLAAHAVGPALGLAQVHVDARQEVTAKNLVRGTQGQQIIRTLCIQYDPGKHK